MKQNETLHNRRRMWLAGVGAAAVLSVLAPTAWASGTNSGNTTQSGAGTATPVAVPASHPGGLVALGDSITFGYNLNPANLKPAAGAYPYLAGSADHLPVTDLGVPGWTSGDLLTALSSPNFQRAIESARVVTIDIGSNDLLGLADRMGLLQQAATGGTVTITPAEQQEFQQAIVQMSSNLGKTVAAIKTETNAPIVLYNLYDPFPSQSALSAVAEEFTTAANQAIAAVGAAAGVPVLDAYSAFNGKQLALVRIAENDVHPTPAGQQVLADLLEQELAKLTLPAGAAAGSSAAVTTDLATNPVDVTGNSWTAALGSGQVTVTTPANAVAYNGDVALTEESLSALKSLAPTGDKVVAELGVDFPQLDMPTSAVTVQYVNQSIPAGAKVYEISAANGLVAVPGVTVKSGQVSLSVIGNADFVVVAAKPAVTPPSKKPIPGGTNVSTGFPWLTEGIAGLLILAFGLLVVQKSRRRHNEEDK